MERTRDELQEVFRSVFDDDDLVISPSTTAMDVDGWDSMAHINLIVAVEKHFDFKFTAQELAATRDEDGNVGNLIELIAAKASP